MHCVRSLLVVALTMLALGCAPPSPRPADANATPAAQPMPEWLERVPPMPQSP